MPLCIFRDLSNGSVLIPKPDANLVKSSFLIGWIEGIAARSNCLFCASFSISSSDFD